MNFRGVGVIRQDPADLRGRHEDVGGFLLLEEFPDGGLVGELELGVGSGEEIPEAPARQATRERRSRKTPVARDVDPRVQLHVSADFSGSPYSRR